MTIYQNPLKPDHDANNAAFWRVVNEYPAFNLYQPSPDRAPWHWQAVINGHYVNFWPHTLKVQREGFKAVQGVHAIRGVIEGALEDTANTTERG